MVRLFVIPARDEPIAVILRRGPSKWYHIIQWDTCCDNFSHGAWIKGRIYEEKCDVSPDGRLFVYNVRQGSRISTEFTDSWTAVSRVPWLHALVVWPYGTTYAGGGRFRTNRELSLRTLWYNPQNATHTDFPLHGIRVVADGKVPLHMPTQDVPDADWCGTDQQGSVIFTRAGCVFRRVCGTDKMIADFTDLAPDPQPAPEWARIPL